MLIGLRGWLVRYITILLQSSWNDIYTCGMCILSSLVSRSSIVGRVGKPMLGIAVMVYPSIEFVLRRLSMDSLRMS